jgi:AcrR family transcriptional regulator
MIVEDLLQLMLDDASGALVADGTRVDYGLAGAVLVELALLERVVVEPAKRPANSVVRVVGGPTGEPVLDQVLARIAEKPRKAAALVPRLSRGLRGAVIEGLVARGALREQKGRLLGIFPTRRWPAVDTTSQDAVRRRLHEVLVQGLTPDPRTAALVSLVAQRAAAIGQGEWASAAVRSAVQAAQAATTAGIVGASAAVAASS